MQKLEATFDPAALERVMNSVLALGVRCQLAASEVRYADETIQHMREYRGLRYVSRWELRARLEVVVADQDADAVTRVLVAELDTDWQRDDALTMTQVDDALRIHTARRGEFAFFARTRG